MGKYLRDHWEGRHSLVKSYWINGMALGFAYHFISEVIIPESFFWYYFLIGIIIQVWQYVGIWRSSNNYKGRNLWSGLAKVAVALGIISTVMGVGLLLNTILLY